MHPPFLTKERLALAAAAGAFGLVLILWLLYTPAGLLGKADAIGYAVCHRIAERSFKIGDRQIALCARCTGQFLGVLVTLAFLHWTSKRKAGIPPVRVLVVIGLLLLAWGLDGANSFATLFPGFDGIYPPGNAFRLFTGFGFGMAMGTAVHIIFHQVIWQEPDFRPALSGWRQLAGLAAVNLAAGGLVWTQISLLLYPLTIMSALGVLAALGMIYSVLWTTIFRRENTFTRLRQVAPFALAGITLAFVQVALIDLARYWITGTWEGFHIFL